MTWHTQPSKPPVPIHNPGVIMSHKMPAKIRPRLLQNGVV
jgi:hypothetical protein